MANCTVPAGVPALDVTVAVKVTLWPKFDGFAEEVTEVVVEAFEIVRLKDASVVTPQLSVARIVMVWVPPGRALLMETTPEAFTEMLPV
jgi:hypothetical protein